MTPVLLAEGALERKHRFCGYFSFYSYGQRTFTYTFVLKKRAARVWREMV